MGRSVCIHLSCTRLYCVLITPITRHYHLRWSTLRGGGGGNGREKGLHHTGNRVQGNGGIGGEWEGNGREWEGNERKRLEESNGKGMGREWEVNGRKRLTIG